MLVSGKGSFEVARAVFTEHGQNWSLSGQRNSRTYYRPGTKMSTTMAHAREAVVAALGMLPEDSEQAFTYISGLEALEKQLIGSVGKLAVIRANTHGLSTGTVYPAQTILMSPDQRWADRITEYGINQSNPYKKRSNNPDGFNGFDTALRISSVAIQYEPSVGHHKASASLLNFPLFRTFFDPFKTRVVQEPEKIELITDPNKIIEALKTGYPNDKASDLQNLIRLKVADLSLRSA